VYGDEEKPKHGESDPFVFDPEHDQRIQWGFTCSTPGPAEEVLRDAEDSIPARFGKDILPGCLGRPTGIAYDFVDINAKAARYGATSDLDAFYDANHEFDLRHA